MLAFFFWWSAVAGAQVPLASGRLRSASAIAYDAAGNLYIADANAHQVFEATLGGSLVVVAGTGTQGYAGDGGPAIAAGLNRPQGLVVDLDGTVYIADTGNQRVRAVSPKGVITTIAGTGTAGFSGDGGKATAAVLRRPTALAMEPSGAVLVCDTGNHRVRQVRAGLISTVVGSGLQGFSGDGGPAKDAALDSPGGLAVASDGRIFVADTRNQRIRVMDAAGNIATYAGMGSYGFAGDGAAAISAQLADPQGLALEQDGSLLVADAGNRRVRVVDPHGVISTFAGSGTEGTSAEGSAALRAEVRAPRSLAISSFGLPVIADALSATVQVTVNGVGLYQPAALTVGRVSSVVHSGVATGVYGQATTAASVSGSVGIPQGLLQVAGAGQILSESTLSSGAASVRLDALAAGSHDLTLLYAGDGLNPAVQLAGLQASITPAAVTATALATPMTYGASTPTISGTLTGVLPQDAADVSAVYSVDVAGLVPVGTYPITVTLKGAKAGNYTVSMAPGSAQLTVVRATASALVQPVTQAYAGVPFVVSATLTSTTQGEPTGTVQFVDGNTVVATASVFNGLASATYPQAAAGKHQIAAVYLGDQNFLPTTSPSYALPVAPLPDFEIASVGPQAVQVAQGATASYSLKVAANPGPFTGAIVLSAAGLPAGAIVNFSPPQVVPGLDTATVTMSVQMAGTHVANQAGSTRGRVSESSLALLCIAGIGWRRRRHRTSLLCLMVCFVFTGCGARTVGEGLGGVVSQSYALQVTATATNLAGVTVVHSLPLTLTVQQ